MQVVPESTLVEEDASSFQKTFDIACNFYKVLETACEILQPLQYDSIKEAFRCILQKVCFSQ